MADPTTLQDAVSALNQVATGQEQLLAQFQGKQADIEANNQAMQDWQTQPGTVPFKDAAGNMHNIPTLKALVEDAQTINPNPHVMTKAEFDALREIRKQQYAGSGFVEWGKHDSGYPNINEGLWQYVAAGNENRLTLGCKEQNNYTGTSRTFNPIVVIDGVQHVVAYVGRPDIQSRLSFPPAPDGTKTYDSATGTVTQHSNAEVAFASETDTNKVITSRKDLVFLESWHEKIADKDVVYPLGNVQYGANSYQGIALLNNLVAQGYSAFGEWDSNTKGYGVKWSSLTDEQKAVFLGEPEHNIYYDPKAKAYIQVRYRVRVVEGFGDDWRACDGANKSYNLFLTDSTSGNHVIARGSKSNDFSDYQNGSNINLSFRNYDPQYGLSAAGAGETYWGDRGITIGKCFAVPIALVQRLNQGAYHPTYNPMGCNRFTKVNVGNYHWYNLPANYVPSVESCFKVGTTTSIGYHSTFGKIAGGDTGRNDQYKYCDAIYAGQVEDLRLNANKQDVNQLRENVMRQAVAGTFRGKGKLLFTRFKALHKGYFGGSNIHNAIFKNAVNNGESLNFYDNDFPMYTPVMVWQPSTNTTLYGQVSTSNSHIMLTNHPSNLGKGKHIDPDVLGLNRADICYFAEVNTLSPEFDSLPWVDIIGSPENIAATFPGGVVGQWIPEIPDGSSKRFRLNRKLRQALAWTLTTSNGNEWTSGTLNIDEEKNTYVSPAEVSRVQLLYYESPANFTAYADNSLVLGNVGEVYSTDFFQLHWGNRLQGSLTNKVNTNSQYNGIVDRYLSLESFTYGQGALHSNRLPKHAPIVGGAGNSSNGAGLKVLPTVTARNGLLYLQFHGAELKHQAEEPLLVNSSILQSYSKGKLYRFVVGAYKGRIVKALASATVVIEDVSYINRSGEIVGMESGNVVFTPANPRTSWGDDQTIPIISGENTKIDLNGNTVKVFCHHTMFPIGIAHNG